MRPAKRKTVDINVPLATLVSHWWIVSVCVIMISVFASSHPWHLRHTPLPKQGCLIASQRVFASQVVAAEMLQGLDTKPSLPWRTLHTNFEHHLPLTATINFKRGSSTTLTVFPPKMASSVRGP